MVYVNDKKFACETCIKGHRSSSCHHTDRPLYEIKKKGRPVSQCERCRELRQIKKKHTKCTCTSDSNIDQASLELASTARPKSRRFTAIAPALPNGLKDAFQTPSSQLSDPRQKVDSLLNPCRCDTVRNCRCQSGDSAHSCGETSSPAEMNTGLAALAHAASLCCEAPTTLESPPPSNQGYTHIPNNQTSSRKHGRESPQLLVTTSKGKRRSNSGPVSPHRGPDLPPIQLGSPTTPSSTTSFKHPVFLTIPPMSTFASLAGSGCSCGLRCACPGCKEHRGAEQASSDEEDCPGCGSCIDYDGGVELPAQAFVTRMTTTTSATSSAASGSSNNNVIDQFFARAAALPLPPSNRQKIDSVNNSTRYPNHSVSETPRD